MEPGPRVRYRGGFEPVTRFSTPEQTILECTGVTNTYNYNMADLLSGTYEYCQDVVVKNFRSRRAAGEIFNNPYYKYTDERTVDGSSTWEIRTTCLPGSKRTQRVNSGTVVPGMKDGDMILPSDGDISSAITLAGTSAAANVQQPDLQLLVELAEAKEAIRMLTNPTGSLLQLIREAKNSTRYSKFRKKRVRTGGPSSLLAFLSAEWLRYRYGIMPLCYSIEGALKATLAISSPRFTARGSSSYGRGEEEFLLDDLTTGWHADFNYNRKIYGTNNGYVRAGILYEHNIQTATRLGITPFDAPSAAWEIIPFSFVADWFVNLGDYLEAVKPKVGVNYLATWTTIKKDLKSRMVVTLLPTGYPGHTQDPGGMWSYSRRVRSTQRTPGVSIGLASKTSEFHWRETDVKHAIDAIALINQLLR